jgi:hypothetical protein
MMKKLMIILGIAVVHFGLVQLVNYLGIAATSADFTGDGTLSLWASSIVWISRILYFPVITLGIFSRIMFPGSLIFIPIILNSLLWGGMVYFLYALVRKIKHHHVGQVYTIIY